MTPEAKKKAAEAKTRGDEAFKRKEYDIAVDAYTQVHYLAIFNSYFLNDLLILFLIFYFYFIFVTILISFSFQPCAWKKFLLACNSGLFESSFIWSMHLQAIDLDPTDGTLLSNRSLCWLRLGQAEQALVDAKTCRALRPDWPKACYREGAALRLLQAFFMFPLCPYLTSEIKSS